jgi:hypothetical protein
MIQTGTAWYTADSPEWNLHTGTGDRFFRPADVKFDPPFDASPHVVLALAGVDCSHEANLRLDLEAYDIEPGEFSIRIKAWDDTLVFGVQLTWIAHD